MHTFLVGRAYMSHSKDFSSPSFFFFLAQLNVSRNMGLARFS